MTIPEFFQSRGCEVKVSGTGTTWNTISITNIVPAFQTRLFCKMIHYPKDHWDVLGSKLIAVLANGARFKEGVNYDLEELIEFANASFIRLSPDDKLDIVLNRIYSLSTHEGQYVDLRTPTDNEANALYFGNTSEWLFYLELGLERNLIKKQNPPGGHPSYQLSIDGIYRLIKLNERTNSKVCFVTMAFTTDMFQIAEQAIKPALVSCGFTPYLVSDQQVESDVTINDAILAGIKRARFTIADFTYHKDGVYFEAGYALGRGQPVIYTCREDQITSSHFDVRNYQHIVWADAADFKMKLINKIEAFIKD